MAGECGGGEAIVANEEWASGRPASEGLPVTRSLEPSREPASKWWILNVLYSISPQ